MASSSLLVRLALLLLLRFADGGDAIVLPFSAFPLDAFCISFPPGSPNEEELVPFARAAAFVAALAAALAAARSLRASRAPLTCPKAKSCTDTIKTVYVQQRLSEACMSR